MRSHPVVGTFFLLLAAGLFALGIFASWAPPFVSKIPIPPEVVVPFVLLQLSLWCAFFGMFFLRARSGRRGSATASAAPRS